MTKDKVANLILKLDTQSDKSAEKIISKLVVIGKPAVSALIKAAKDESEPRIRKWSLQALGAIADKRSGPLLLEALKDQRMTVRLHAVRGLGKMKFKKGVQAVADLLKDESGGVRVNAISALMMIGDSSAGPALQKALSDSQWYVRQNACTACGVLGIQKAKSKLKVLAKKDPKKAVREAASRAIEQI